MLNSATTPQGNIVVMDPRMGVILGTVAPQQGILIISCLLIPFSKIDSYVISRFIHNLIGWKCCHTIAMYMAT